MRWTFLLNLIFMKNKTQITTYTLGGLAGMAGYGSILPVFSFSPANKSTRSPLPLLLHRGSFLLNKHFAKVFALFKRLLNFSVVPPPMTKPMMVKMQTIWMSFISNCQLMTHFFTFKPSTFENVRWLDWFDFIKRIESFNCWNNALLYQIWWMQKLIHH